MMAVASSIPVPHSGVSDRESVVTAGAIPVAWSREDFEREIEPHLPRMYRMCLALCRNPAQAEDLLQNSLVKAYLGRQGFEGRGSLAGWLFGIVRHEHDDLVRTTARRRSLMNRAFEQCVLVAEDLLAVAPADPETWTGVCEEGAILLDCLETIPEPYRLVVWLCDVEELSHEEIAKTLGIAEGTVKSRHARGRARLRLAYERRLHGKHPGGT